MEPISPGWVQLLQAGGVLAFAGLVLYILSKLPGVLKTLLETFLNALAEITKVLNDVKQLLSALLERERVRAERIAAQDAARGAAVPQPWPEDEETAPLAMPVKQRARTNPGGYSINLRDRGKDG